MNKRDRDFFEEANQVFGWDDENGWGWDEEKVGESPARVFLDRSAPPLVDFFDRPAPMELIEEEDEDEEEDEEEVESYDDPVYTRDLEPPAKRLRLDPGIEAAEKASRAILRELNSVQSFYNALSLRIRNEMIALSNREAQAYNNAQRIYSSLAPEDSPLDVNARFSVHLDEILSVWNTIRDARDQLAVLDDTVKAALKFQKEMPSRNYDV